MDTSNWTWHARPNVFLAKNILAVAYGQTMLAAKIKESARNITYMQAIVNSCEQMQANANKCNQIQTNASHCKHVQANVSTCK